MAATDTPPTGRKADKVIRDALMAVSRQDPTKVKRLAEKWWDMALEGDLQAIDKLTDRLDGKAIQPIVGDDEHSPVNVITKMVVELVGSKNPTS